MMKKNSFWSLTPLLATVCAAMLLVVGVTFFLNRIVFLVEIPIITALLAGVVWQWTRMKSDIRRTLSHVADSLDETQKTALLSSPLPILVSSAAGEILWYNELFHTQILMNEDAYGDPLTSLTGGVSVGDFQKKGNVDIVFGTRRFTAFSSFVQSDGPMLCVLYYVENTRLKQIAEEYALSRPAVILLYIDNMDELLQNARDSERAQISGKVETLIEDWVSSTSGLLIKYAHDRFLLIVEQRHLQPMIVNKFDILDRVRAVQTGERLNVTLSIGVGQGENLRESEALARQAMDMALGRGGDQAAVKTKNGFNFYGGVSKGIEKRTKVRTRVVASALLELIQGSDMVLVMGHRYSDLDCLGASAALASVIRSLGRPAFAVVRREQSLADGLLDRYEAAGRGDIFLEPEEARPMMTRKTLLIITDTHSVKILESPEIYGASVTTVIIDHHRKLVDFIDNAVIFYHEPYSSSTCELVAELVQYLGSVTLSRLDAEGLLAGIMLDTRNFVLKAGVRTFEAAAYLRRLGADTVEVKRLFAGSMDLYREKAGIIESARLYRQAAVAVADSAPDSERENQLRIAAAQAADELLYIKGVEASFVLYTEGTTVNVSARSFGAFNVQLVMEALGGGGHLSMAGTQLPNTTTEKVRAMLIQAIDTYLADRERAVPTTQPPQTALSPQAGGIAEKK